MLTCKHCLRRMKLEVPEKLILGTCGVCFNPLIECAEDQKVNIDTPNWNKGSEDKSSFSDFKIPENGLYLWLRPNNTNQQ